jgi:hypothetical protein
MDKKIEKVFELLNEVNELLQGTDYTAPIIGIQYSYGKNISVQVNSEEYDPFDQKSYAEAGMNGNYKIFSRKYKSLDIIKLE